MNDWQEEQIRALRAQLADVTRERDQALAHLDLTVEALEAIRLHEIACDRGDALSGDLAKRTLQLVRPAPAVVA